LKEILFAVNEVQTNLAHMKLVMLSDTLTSCFFCLIQVGYLPKI